MAHISPLLDMTCPPDVDTEIGLLALILFFFSTNMLSSSMDDINKKGKVV